MTKCPTCGSSGFAPSSQYPFTRCTFCDGTEGGNPPDTRTMQVQGPTGLERREYTVDTRTRRKVPNLRDGEQVHYTLSGEAVVILEQRGRLSW